MTSEKGTTCIIITRINRKLMKNNVFFGTVLNAFVVFVICFCVWFRRSAIQDDACCAICFLTSHWYVSCCVERVRLDM